VATHVNKIQPYAEVNSRICWNLKSGTQQSTSQDVDKYNIFFDMILHKDENPDYLKRLDEMSDKTKGILLECIDISKMNHPMFH